MSDFITYVIKEVKSQKYGTRKDPNQMAKSNDTTHKTKEQKMPYSWNGHFKMSKIVD